MRSHDGMEHCRFLMHLDGIEGYFGCASKISDLLEHPWIPVTDRQDP